LEKETGAKIIVGCEDSSLMGDILGYMKFGPCQGLRLNAGTYIGRAKHMIELSELCEQQDTGHHDDQISMTEVCKQRPSDFHIDQKEEIFSLYSTSFYEFHKPIPHAFFVHANGCSFMNDLLNDLGYHVDRSKMNQELANYFFSKLVHHLRVYFADHWFPYFISICSFLLIMIFFRMYWLWKIPVFLFALCVSYGFFFFLFSSWLWESIE